jgi:hypothetical protein
VSAARLARRLAFAALCLAAVDPLIPGWVASAEASRYESGAVFRFENSDIFALGPLVTYLREHPQGRRPRIAFLGNSVVWGYGLPAADSVAAQFQTRVPDAHVLNLGINRSETGDSYLIAKAMLDAVSTLYVFNYSVGARHTTLPQVIPVAGEDLARFGLTSPPQHSGNQLLSFWRLFRDSYRIQAACLGTSVRVFLYTRLAAAGHALGRQREPTDAAQPGDLPAIAVDSRIASAPPSAERLTSLSSRHRLLWDFAQMVRARQRSAVFVEISGLRDLLPDDDRADLNAVFGPDVRFVRVDIPDTLRLDPVHLTAAGAGALAETLSRLRPGGPGR